MVSGPISEASRVIIVESLVLTHFAIRLHCRKSEIQRVGRSVPSIWARALVGSKDPNLRRP